MFSKKGFAVKADKKEIIKMVIEDLIKNHKEDKETPEYKILKIGRLLEGIAYNHETDSSYYEIGLELEIECRYSFMDKSEKNVGFYSIWTASKKSYDPIDFEESHQEIGKPHRFSNGCGDELMVTKELKSLEIMDETLKELIKNKEIEISK